MKTLSAPFLICKSRDDFTEFEIKAIMKDSESDNRKILQTKK